MDGTVRVYNAATYSCLVWDKPADRRYHVFCGKHHKLGNCPVHKTGYKRTCMEV